MDKELKPATAIIIINVGDGADALVAGAFDYRTTEAPTSRSFVAYAAPLLWGPDVTVASHIGVATYTISYRAVGETLVLGRVTYYKGPGGGSKVTEEFRDETYDNDCKCGCNSSLRL